MSPPIAYDLTRLCFAPPTASPRGIDRVDVMFGAHFFDNWAGDCFAIIPTPWGVRSFDRRLGKRILQHVNQCWSEDLSCATDPRYQWTRARIIGAATQVLALDQDNSRPLPMAVAGRMFRLFQKVGLPLGAPVGKSLPKGAVYFNIGQAGMSAGRLLSWLDRRPDVHLVAMLHDAIPLASREFISDAGWRHYSAMIENTARYASGLIVSTEAEREDMLRVFDQRTAPCVHVSPLPLPAPFLRPIDVDTELRAAPYFVFCGTIEIRKNLMLLLNVWRELARRFGEATPKLVVIGATTPLAAETAHILARSDLLKPHVVQAQGLSSDALRQLIAHARALLWPSFAEGFGLPIIEAISVGTPVIASDIPVHREVAGDYATYLSPIDGLGWLDAVVAHQDRDPLRAQKLAAYKPLTCAAYFERMEPLFDCLRDRGLRL